MTGAVKLVLNGQFVSEVAGDLDLNPSMLARWKREYLKDQKGSFPNKSNLRPEDEELCELSADCVMSPRSATS